MWEYKYLGRRYVDDLMNDLNREGANGWELVNWQQIDDEGRAYYEAVMKRRRQ